MEIQLILGIVLLTGFTQSAEWDYGVNGPSTWGTHFPLCANTSTSQSPINIVAANAIRKDDLGAFTAAMFPKPTTMELKNNGHSVQVDVTGGYTISDISVLPSDYVLAQFHFHWANSPSNGGSEHTVDGTRYFGEFHAVHYKKEYGSVTRAKNESKGLAVLGVFLEASGNAVNQQYETIFSLLPNITLKDDSIAIDMPFPISDLLPSNLSDYYRYDGSLTTPTCDESVIWTVFGTPVRISISQATQLATSVYEKNETKTEDLVNNNYRPVQSLNTRNVYVTGDGAVIKASVVFTTVLCYFASKFNYIIYI